jgi:hypothetical protein
MVNDPDAITPSPFSNTQFATGSSGTSHVTLMVNLPFPYVSTHSLETGMPNAKNPPAQQYANDPVQKQNCVFVIDAA